MYYKLFCVVSWCHISRTAIQLYSQAAWMEGRLHFNGNSAHWHSVDEDCNAECWVQDGADTKEAAVVSAGNMAQCDVVFGAIHPYSGSLCDVVFMLPLTVRHLPSITTVCWLLWCVDMESFQFVCVTPCSNFGCCGRRRTDKIGASSL